MTWQGPQLEVQSLHPCAVPGSIHPSGRSMQRPPPQQARAAWVRRSLRSPAGRGRCAQRAGCQATPSPGLSGCVEVGRDVLIMFLP